MIQNTDSVDRIDDPKSKCLEKQYVYTDEPFKRTSDLASATTDTSGDHVKVVATVEGPPGGHTCTHGTTINSGSQG